MGPDRPDDAVARPGHYRRGMRRVPVAAAAHVAPVLAGSARPAVVGAVFSVAIVLDCTQPVLGGTGSGGATVVLLAPRAAAVPLGVRSTEPLPPTHIGAPAQVGDGGLTLAGTTFRLVRTWSSRVPTIDPGPDRLAELTQPARAAALGLDSARLRELAGAIRGDDRTRLLDTVRSLVGLGSGSTPAGDDVLAGLLVGLHARGRADLVAGVSAGIDPSRTTRYSAALLAAAAAGHAALEALAVLHRLHRPAHPGRIYTGGPKAHVPTYTGPQKMITEHDPVRTLLALGHTSGADLTAGLLLGLAVDPPPVDRTEAA